MGIARLGLELLLQAAQAFPDTVVTKQVEVEQGLFEKISGIAQGLMTIAILVLTVVLVPAAWNFRNSYKRVNELIDRFYGDIAPLVRHANAIADNVNYITTSVRVDVQQFNQTVTLANQRLTTAVKAAERRLQELDALLAVVQREAEEAFVTTASTLRGVRAGASTLRAEVEGEAMAEADDFGDDDGIIDDEGSHGDDSAAEDDEWRERPRVRPRSADRA